MTKTLLPLRLVTLSAAGLVAALVLGCASSDAARPGHQPPHKQAPKPGADGLVLAPAKHNGSGVVLRYAAPPALKPGDTATVQLQFSNITAPEGAQVELVPGDAQTQISIDGAPVTAPLQLAAGTTHTLQVQVSSSEDGAHDLNVFTRQAGRSSAQSVRLRFGSGQVRQKDNGSYGTTPSGERVISLPAR